MTHIHWYPGHIAKAERKLKEQLSLVDVIIEIIDSRLPISSMYPNIKKLTGEKPRLILLNKSDLSSPEQNAKWVNYIKEKSACDVFLTSANDFKDVAKITSKVIELGQPAILKLVQKGMLPRAVRVMVVGMPNVGKSSIINKLIKKAKTKTGAKAGVTKIQQWVRINPKIDLLDTPGIIPLKQEEQDKAYKLAFVNSIGENAYDEESVCVEFINVMERLYPDLLKNHYILDENDEVNLENIAIKRKWIISGGKPDTKRTAQNVLQDFRLGRLGKITLDEFN